MNAGKSTTLLQADFNYRERGMETMLWTASFDDRAGGGTIGSRIALSAPAHAYDETVNLFAEVADTLGIPVLCYGLRTDFQAKLFPGSAALLALADTLIELKAVCECGRKATMNLRVDAEGHAIVRGQQTEIGGNDRYVALCRKHFFERLHESRARQLSLGLARPR